MEWNMYVGLTCRSNMDTFIDIDVAKIACSSDTACVGFADDCGIISKCTRIVLESQFDAL